MVEAPRRTRHVVVVDNSALAKAVGERIRTHRERSRLTQAQLAGDRYTAAYISALERGLAKPSLASMAYLAPRLGTRIAELVDVEQDEPDALDPLEPDLRIRIHERIQEATGLISQAEDDLPRDHPAKEQLRDLGKRVWELGYEILGDARYTPVEDLAAIIAELDEQEPFLAGEVIHLEHGGVEVLKAAGAPRRAAERILERLHEVEPVDLSPSSIGSDSDG